MRRTRDERTAEGRLGMYRLWAAMAAGGALSAGEQAMLTLRMREVERAVQRLPIGDERLVIELHDLGGLSLEACAERLGISRSTVYRCRRRALERLEASWRRRTVAVEKGMNGAE